MGFAYPVVIHPERGERCPEVLSLEADEKSLKPFRPAIKSLVSFGARFFETDPSATLVGTCK